MITLNPISAAVVAPIVGTDFTLASLDPRITVSRTTDATHPATYINSSGYITTALNDAARFDYNPATKVCKGLLVEEAKANLCKYSQDFSNGAWTLSNATIGAATTSPDGTSDGQSLMETTASGAHRFYLTASITVTNGAAYTFSVFAKSNGRNFIRISDGNVTGVTCFFDLGTGSVGTIGAGVTAQSITDFGNGWYRCSITYTMVGTAAANAFVISTDGSTVSYTGDASKGVYVYGAQLESGTLTSYVPTTSASLTRNADTVSITGTNFSGFYNTPQGAWYIETLAKNADTILTAGSLTIAANATATKKYAASYTSDQSASSLVLGPGTVKTLRYYPHALPTAILNRLTA